MVLIALLTAIILHEVAHAIVAKWNGDLTAKFAKRISLNPARHFSVVGFIMMVFVGFGFAKPVPVNADNFRNRKRGTVLVAFAGILVNLSLALTAAFFLVIIERFGPFNSASGYYFHFYPFIWLPRYSNALEVTAVVFAIFFSTMVQINIALALFNILPLYPLDGHRLLEAGLGSYNKVVKFLRNWGLAILLGLVGFEFVISLVSAQTGVMIGNQPLSVISPLGSYMRFVGGTLGNTMMNLFRVMFGVTPQWLV